MAGTEKKAPPITVADGFHDGEYGAKVYTLARGDGRVLFVKEYGDKLSLVGFPVYGGFKSVDDTLFPDKDGAIERARTILAEMA